MLADNFKTAAELGLPQIEQEALVTVLRMLERGEIRDKHFDMTQYRNECGTIGCYCGWANVVSQGRAFPELTQHRDAPWRAQPLLRGRLPQAALDLFGIEVGHSFVGLKAAQGAIVLREYLTTGTADWSPYLA